MKRTTSTPLSKSTPTCSLSPSPLSSRRKRKHVDVEFEPAKKDKVNETREIKSLEKGLKKEMSNTGNNKVSLNQ
jgi:hypothetical protein